MSQTIAELNYPGTADNFRAFIEGFLASLQAYYWTSSDGKRFEIFYDHTLHNSERNVWSVRYADQTGEVNNKCAAIFASQYKPNETRIVFIDGVLFLADSQKAIPAERDPIGTRFTELVNAIKAKLDLEEVKKPDPIIKSLEIEPIEYDGPVTDFRAWMDKFLIRGSGVTYLNVEPEKQKEIIKKAFEEHQGRGDIVSFTEYYQHLLLNYSSEDKDINREVWYALLYDPDISKTSTQKWATILAVESPHNHTTVEFLDGIYFRLVRQDGTIGHYVRGNPIGDKFSQYVQFIKDEWEKRESSSSDDKTNAGAIKHLDAERIEPAYYPGSIEYFRGWMDRFLAVNGAILRVEKDTHTLEYHIGYFTPAQTKTREVWNIYIDPRIVVDGKRPGDSLFAMILAVQENPDMTIVEFIDGQRYERTGYSTRSSPDAPVLGHAHLAFHKPIGPDFLLIAERIKAAMPRNHDMEKIILKYPGSIEHFRALIDQLRTDKQHHWISSTGEVLAIWDYFEHGNENKKVQNKSSTWEIVLHDEENMKRGRRKQGIIQAFESLPNITVINCYDGKSFNRILGFQDAEKIGTSFEELVDVIAALWEEPIRNEQSAILKEPNTRNLKDWFDYYYAVKGRLKIPMEYIAEKTGYSVSTVYKEHTYYKNEHQVPKKLVRKSKKK